MGKSLLILLLFCSCYNQRKASQQFSRAIVFDPKLPADYCASQFPAHNTVTHDTTSTTDTLYFPPEFVTDTVRDHDTLVITHTITLPGKVITVTHTITDTVFRENTAALKACQIDNSRLVATIGPLTAERDKFLKRSRTYFWIILALGAVIGVSVYNRVASAFKPKA